MKTTPSPALAAAAAKFAETEQYCDPRFTATNAFEAGAAWGHAAALGSAEVRELIAAAVLIRLDWSGGGDHEADAEELPYIRGHARLNIALKALRESIEVSAAGRGGE